MAYTLNNEPGFYNKLDACTDSIMGTEYFDLLRNHAKDFIHNHIDKKQTESKRHELEYVIELYIMGILLKNYSGFAEQGNAFIMYLNKFLNRNRKKIPSLKKKIDIVRGFLISTFLFNQPNTKSSPIRLAKLSKTIKWLDATGDFKEEVIRLQAWKQYFSENKKVMDKIEKDLRRAIIEFENISTFYLSRYTSDIHIFLKDAPLHYKNREDVVFCQRKENEYHLNMVSATILNRVFNADYKKTSKKIILLPTCMRGKINTCKAKRVGTDIICTQCNPDCNIFKARKSLSNTKNIEIRLIPHSSDFSKWLKKYENTRETGLIGVACVLNLLCGGYEMRRLNIPSQCIFLDNCGCSNHWYTQQKATAISHERLAELVNMN